jgi:hypothetical protein
MGRKKGRNRVELIGWLVLVTAMLAVFVTRPQSPQAADANSLPMTSISTAGPQGCRSVIDQIVSIAKDENVRANLTSAPPLAAVVQCVTRQEKIDTTGCPADFRLAVSRFISAEQSLSRDAREDSGSDADVVRRAFFDVYAHRSPYDTLDRMSDKIKRDLDIFQSATFDLIQVSSAYGVN